MLRKILPLRYTAAIGRVPRVPVPLFSFHRRYSAQPNTATPLGQIPDSQRKLLIHFECKPCSHKNIKFMSKLAYEKGVVIIKCDGCERLHLMADHLGWFDSQKKVGTIEDIMREKGEEIQKLEDLADLPEETLELVKAQLGGSQ